MADSGSVARDVANGPMFNSDPMNQLARLTKRNLTTMFLAFNLKTVSMQATGLAQAAAVIGKRNMLHGLMAYAGGRGDMIGNVVGASEFMAERQRTFQKDIVDMRADPAQSSPVADKLSRARRGVENWGFAPIQAMQFYAVDVPVWSGAYRGKTLEGASHEAAVEYADRMVARSQDSGLMGDRSALARGTLNQNTRQSDIVRFFTTLGGYMLTKMNRGVIAIERGGEGHPRGRNRDGEGRGGGEHGDEPDSALCCRGCAHGRAL